ncbi:hypothetical protein MNBD_GAMMA04-684 [hydrothermal vent metagenome]|uniref:Lipoprotein n=1 Tax=hydrothermal vent metagenome TaxID=652676 RepID=A0A3B0VXM5_9ZZZZ
MKHFFILLMSIITLSACSTMQEVQIIQTGANSYEMTKTDNNYPGAGILQKEITREAMGLCRSLKKRLHTISIHETKPPFAGSKVPLAEIKFECLDRKH